MMNRSSFIKSLLITLPAFSFTSKINHLKNDDISLKDNDDGFILRVLNSPNGVYSHINPYSKYIEYLLLHKTDESVAVRILYDVINRDYRVVFNSDPDCGNLGSPYTIIWEYKHMDSDPNNFEDIIAAIKNRIIYK